MPLPSPQNQTLNFPKYYDIGMWLSLGIGIIFLGNYAYQLGRDNRIRSEALNKLEQELTNEKVVNSVGGIAAAAVHELATPLATISLVSKELQKQISKNNYEFDTRVSSSMKKDVEYRLKQTLMQCGFIC